MGHILVYRNRYVTEQDISYIRRLIINHPGDSRCALSKRICRAWNWVQPNGHLKEMICRGLLLRLEREGYIELPPRKSTPPNPFLHRRAPEPIEVDEGPIEASLQDIFPITIHQVRRTSYEKLFNWLIEKHHYLGYTQPVGEHLKYLVFSQGRPIAALAWSSASWHLGPRDRFIGWMPEVRKKNLHLIAYNTRFLIPQWVHVSCLASYLLALNRQCLSQDWQRLYHHPVYLVESFVDTKRYSGTCYKADNWIYVGQTTGRGRLSKSQQPVLSKKAVYVYPLTRNFRRQLCHDA